MATASITVTSAPPGVGKTYCRGARFLVDEFLPEGQGVYISNLPMEFEDWKDGEEEREGLVSMVGRLHGLAEEDIRSRVVSIPREELAKWMADEECGPWSTFAGMELDGAHIAIDEAHLYWPRAGRPDAARRMIEWLSEVRHRGATVELITQHETQLAEGLVKIANHRLVLMKADDQVDPVFGIALFDWFQVWSRWTGAAYRSVVRQDLYVPEGRRQRLIGSRVWEISPEYFGVYRSHSAPLRGGKAGKGRKLPAERLGRWEILAWLVGRHPWRVLSRVVLLVACIWLLTGGGGVVIGALQRQIQRAVQPGKTEVGVRAVEAKGEGGGVPVGVSQSDRERIAALISDNGNLLFDKHRLEQEVKGLEVRVRELEAKLGEYGAVVLVSSDEMKMANGDRYRVGETIEFGPYAGAVVKAIESRDRRVRLSDGRVLRLGLSPGARADATASVSRPLPGVNASGGGAAGETGGGLGAANNAQLPGNNGWSVVPMDRGGNGMLNSGSTGAGNVAGVAGDPRGAPGGGYGRSSGSAGGQSGPAGNAVLSGSGSGRVAGRVGASGSTTWAGRDSNGGGRSFDARR